MTLRLLWVLPFIWVVPSLAYGVGANPNPISVIQPDGSTIQIRVRGDEWNRWTSTLDGYHIVKNSRGVFEYAETQSNGLPKASGIKVSNMGARTASEKTWLAGRPQKMLGSVSAASLQKKAFVQENLARYKVRQAEASVQGNYKLLVILANFSDTQTSYGQSDFNDLMNKTNYNGTGSFRDFYLENSGGLLDVSSTVTAWVKVPQTHDYYGPDERWGEFAYQAIKAAYNSGVDLSQFDNDGDGEVEAIAVFHQGKGQEATASTKDIWSHSWSLRYAGYSATQRTFGNVKVDNYIVQAELNGNSSNLSTIGVVAHEFGHALGAYDFYDTDYEESDADNDGTGYWDLMASGAYNGSPSGSKPAHHNAYTKVQLGWVQSELLSEPKHVELQPVISARKVLRINTTTDNEYFLLENRKKTGFDSYLFGEGMLVYHVDDNYIAAYGDENALNATPHQAMYIKAANLDVNSSGCPFPGTSNAIAFHDETNPSSMSWANQVTHKSVTNIMKEGDVVSFDFMAFQDGLPKAFSAEMLNDKQVKVKWEFRDEPIKLLIAYSSENIFGNPVAGTDYQVGDVLPGGGKVVWYSDLQNTLVHDVQVEKTYYYRVWADKSTRFSTPMNTSVYGWREVYFYLNDLDGSPLRNASVECGDFLNSSDSDGSVMFYGNFAAKKLNRFVVRKEGYEEKWGIFDAIDNQSVYVDMKPIKEWDLKIQHETVQNKKVALTWTPVIDENFSGYNAFSTSIGNWTMVDNDKLPTYSFSNYRFDNEGYTGSFIVFDGYADTFVNNGVALESYSGRNFLAAFAAYSETGLANDDWLISPEVEIDSTCWLSFYAASLTDEWGLERLKVLVSTTGASTSSFTKVNVGRYLTIPAEWTFYKYDLSEYKGQKIRFALNCVSSNAFVLMLDKIRISIDEPHKDASVQSVSTLKSAVIGTAMANTAQRKQPTSFVTSKNTSLSVVTSGSIAYQIYRNGKLVGTQTGFASTSFTDNTEDCGIQSYQIKAVDSINGNGASSSVQTFRNCLQKSELYPNPSSGLFNFQMPDGATKASYKLFNVNGQMVDQGEIGSYRFTFDLAYLPKGMYVMKIVHEMGSETLKLMRN